MILSIVDTNPTNRACSDEDKAKDLLTYPEHRYGNPKDAALSKVFFCLMFFHGLQGTP